MSSSGMIASSYCKLVSRINAACGDSGGVAMLVTAPTPPQPHRRLGKRETLTSENHEVVEASLRPRETRKRASTYSPAGPRDSSPLPDSLSSSSS